MFCHRSRGRCALAALVLVASLALLAPAGASAASPTALRVTPRSPLATNAITVSFRAGRLAPGYRYRVDLSLRGGDTNCAGSRSLMVKGRPRPGSPVTVVLRPSDMDAAGNGYPRWCSGDAVVFLGRVDIDGAVLTPRHRDLTIRPDTAYPSAPGTPVLLRVLDGSALTVHADGRPDRTLGIGGELRGLIPGIFEPNTDVQIGGLTGRLWLTSLPTDPLCAGGSIVPSFATDPAHSTSVLQASGHAVLTLALAADPLALAGCAAPSTGSTTLTLEGQVTTAGLQALPLAGSITGVPIASGVTGSVSAAFTTLYDLSGRG